MLKKRILNWIDYKIDLNNQIFTKDLLENKINKFWNEFVEKEVSETQHIFFLFRLQWSNKQIVTIGKLQKLNKEDKNYILNYLMDEMEDKSEYYITTELESMIFSFKIKNGRAKDKVELNNNNNINTFPYQDYQHHKLPITMNPLEYGKLIYKKDNVYAVQVNKTNVAIITQFENCNEVELFREGDSRYKYTDKWIDRENNTFIRILENKQFTFKNNVMILFSVQKSVKFIDSLKKQNILLSNKFLIMDIETFIKDGIHIPYCVSIYDAKISTSYYLLDYKNSETMIINCIKDIMIRKYDNYQIYIHNLSNFDAIFLLKILVNLGNCNPIIHNNKIISIHFKFNSYEVTFKDSKQLLIGSLRSLGKCFRVDTQKSIFPYSFVNENRLNYNSWVPDFKYFNGISKAEYQKYFDGFKYTTWNLRNETIKYCETDCISLYQILIKFNELIFKYFKINIHKYPTLSSLAFAIFRTHFLKRNTIPQLSGEIASNIRNSYTGGAVDMYIPYFKKYDSDTKMYCYDVNSLYPFIMHEKLMPTGNPTLFKGDIRKVDPDAFGFFYCEIIAPDNLEHPILQTHVKVNNLTRTIAPLGTWEDMIFSAEMDNAIKYGYKFEILWGYTFKPRNIFKDYIDTLYQLRLEYPKSNPLNYIAKLLMNSLYGRLGMEDSFSNISIFNVKKDIKSYLLFEKNHAEDIIERIELGDKLLIKHRSKDKDLQTMLYGNLETHNVSIAIASAITAYARIHMSQFKNNPNFKLFYSDTDSIYIDRPLPEDMVSNTILGKMKLENILNTAIFLAPKMYCLITENDEVIYKVKGLSHDIELSIDDFNNLLYKDSSLIKSQIKWNKHLSEGHIKVIEQLYTLKVTENKRKLIYDNNSKLVGTVPFVINKDKVILI